jgi:hypothetical protein
VPARQRDGCPAVPLGGFFDSVLNEAHGLNGVDEAAIHAVALGLMRRQHDQ